MSNDHEEFDKVLDESDLNAIRGIFNALLMMSHILLWCFVLYLLMT
jgi:hypothetical protein